MATKSNPYGLTDRELGIMHTIIVHQLTTTVELSKRLGTTDRTVRTQLSTLYRKMGARNMTHAVLIYLHNDLRTTARAGESTSGSVSIADSDDDDPIVDGYMVYDVTAEETEGKYITIGKDPSRWRPALQSEVAKCK